MKLLDAAAEVDRMARSYRAMETVAEVLRGMGSIENAIEETKARKAKVDTEVGQALAELESVNEKIAAAKTEAKRIFSEAKEKAQRKLDEADTKVIEKLAEGERLYNEALTRRDDLNVESIAITKAVKEARAEYDGLQNKLAGLKNQIAGMLS